MSGEKSKVNLNIGGKHLPFMVHETYEPLYRTAEEMINKRMAKLQNQYGDRATAELLEAVITVEAVVDAIVAKQKYDNLQKDINLKVDQLSDQIL